jgi:hypothetical protein
MEWELRQMCHWYLTGPSGVVGFVRRTATHQQLWPVPAPTATVSMLHKDLGTFAIVPTDTRATPTSTTDAKVSPRLFSTYLQFHHFLACSIIFASIHYYNKLFHWSAKSETQYWWKLISDTYRQNVSLITIYKKKNLLPYGPIYVGHVSSISSTKFFITNFTYVIW